MPFHGINFIKIFEYNAGSLDSLKNSATEREFIFEYNFIL